MKKPGGNWIGYLNNCLQYYMGIDASQLTDDEWIEKTAFLIQIRKKEAEQSQSIDLNRLFFQ